MLIKLKNKLQKCKNDSEELLVFLCFIFLSKASSNDAFYHQVCPITMKAVKDTQICTGERESPFS